MNPILFLDIDGVMNTINSHSNAYGENEHGIWTTKPVELVPGFDEYDSRSIATFDKGCMANLNAIVEKTDCKIVISSSWRIGNSLETLRRIFEAAGFKHSKRITDVTPRLHTIRGIEIEVWLKDNGLDGPSVPHAILDDDSDFTKRQKETTFVHTNADTGLTDELAEKVVNLLLKH